MFRHFGIVCNLIYDSNYVQRGLRRPLWAQAVFELKHKLLASSPPRRLHQRRGEPAPPLLLALWLFIIFVVLIHVGRGVEEDAGDVDAELGQSLRGACYVFVVGRSCGYVYVEVLRRRLTEHGAVKLDSVLPNRRHAFNVRKRLRICVDLFVWQLFSPRPATRLGTSRR